MFTPQSQDSAKVMLGEAIHPKGVEMQENKAKKTNRQIGVFVRDLRERRGFTAIEIAELLRCDIATWRAIEKGETPLSTLQWFDFANMIGISPESIKQAINNTCGCCGCCVTNL